MVFILPQSASTQQSCRRLNQEGHKQEPISMLLPVFYDTVIL